MATSLEESEPEKELKMRVTIRANNLNPTLITYSAMTILHLLLISVPPFLFIPLHARMILKIQSASIADGVWVEPDQ